MTSKKNAFSLVEMLVAVLLLTLLIGVAIFSFRYQLIAITKAQKVGFTKVLTYNQLRTSLASMKHYVVDDYDMLNQTMQNLHVFFNGNKNELTYITESPMFSKEIALAQLKCVDSALVYTEEALYGNIDFLRPQLQESSQEVVFYDNLTACGFSYHVKEKIFEELKNELPTAIAINIQSQERAEEMYVDIRSDYNISVGMINDTIYPIE